MLGPAGLGWRGPPWRRLKCSLRMRAVDLAHSCGRECSRSQSPSEADGPRLGGFETSLGLGALGATCGSIRASSRVNARGTDPRSVVGPMGSLREELTSTLRAEVR